MDFGNIDIRKRYKRLSNGDVFSGRQIWELLDISKPKMQAVILLDIEETTEPVSRPDSKFGV